MEGDKEIGNKLIWMKRNYTEDESMKNIKLRIELSQRILYFDLEQYYISRTDGRISRSWEQNDINEVKFHL